MEEEWHVQDERNLCCSGPQTGSVEAERGGAEEEKAVPTSWYCADDQMEEEWHVQDERNLCCSGPQTGSVEAERGGAEEEKAVPTSWYCADDQTGTEEEWHMGWV